jgi:S1-C subfamily serine protease/antitoxin component YwqK of YwqJK toxin-antitoxin module
MKGFRNFLTVCVVMFGVMTSAVFMANAERDISVLLNDQQIVFDQPPIIESGRTLVPVRAIFEALGATVEWIPETRTILSTNGKTTVILQLDSVVARVNNVEFILDVPAKIEGGRTLVPLRFIGESFGIDVGWDAQSRKINMTEQKQINLTVEDVSKNINSVVFIEMFDKQGEAMGSGSGFFIEEDGTLVTNYHVINKAFEIKVTTNDDYVYSVNKILGYDKERDIAIIKVDNKSKTFEAVVLGDSDDVKIGQAIVSIGTPLMGSLKNTVSTGIVSNIRDGIRDVLNSKDIQITSPISMGNSGGALLNMQGQVIGITYAGVKDGQNLNFAIPINELKLIKTDSSYTVKNFYEKENVIIFSDARYEGNIENGFPNGYGTMVWPNGDVYVGDWIKGQRTGLGVYEWSNGDIYGGNFFEGKRSGFGILKESSGYSYEGDWKDDMKNGFGTAVFSNNNKYIGEWINDQFNGSGTYIWADEEKYIGNWRDGARNGSGRMYHPNGIIGYEGEFLNGKFSGRGKLYGTNGLLFYNGGFVEGLFNGKGIFYFENGDIYDGDFFEGKRDGFGIFTQPSGYLYQGYWKDNMKNGFGKVVFTNNNQYIGDWANDIFDGRGTYIWADGLKYIGDWRDGQQNGRGKMYWPNGALAYDGEFLNGEFSGKGKKYGENGRLRYDGEFANDLFNGVGIFYNENGGIYYEGGFKNGYFHGYGVEYYVQGTVYRQGVYSEGKYIGHSTIDFTPINSNGFSPNANIELYMMEEKKLEDQYTNLVKDINLYYDYIVRQTMQDAARRGMALSSSTQAQIEIYNIEREQRLRTLKEAYDSDLRALKIRYGVN